MTPDQIAELEALAAYVVRLPSGVERANAKAELALFVTHNLPAILAALKAQSDPFAWTEGINWHKPAHRAVMASVSLGSWMSAALDDPNVCDAMKVDIQEWFSAGEPMEILGQALAALKAQRPDEAVVERVARRKFPILGSRGASIDWQLVEDHGRQVMDNHRQTVARLAERGGLSWCELHAVLHNREWQKMDENEAILACRAIEARHRAALKGQP